MWLMVGRCMRWRNADIREESRWFQSKSEALILRQLRRGIVRRRIGMMSQSRLLSLSKFRWGDNGDWLYSMLYACGYTWRHLVCFLSSLTNPFFEDATWSIGSASWSSTEASRCLLQMWRKEWETRASSLRRFVSLCSPTILMIRAMISKGRTADVEEFWMLNFAKGRPGDRVHWAWELFEEIPSGILREVWSQEVFFEGMGKFKQRILGLICRSGQNWAKKLVKSEQNCNNCPDENLKSEG